MEAKEMRSKNNQELLEILEEQRKEIFKLRNERATTKKGDQPHRYRTCKKKIARILTVIGENAG